MKIRNRIEWNSKLLFERLIYNLHVKWDQSPIASARTINKLFACRINCKSRVHYYATHDYDGESAFWEYKNNAIETARWFCYSKRISSTTRAVGGISFKTNPTNIAKKKKWLLPPTNLPSAEQKKKRCWQNSRIK